MGTVCL